MAKCSSWNFYPKQRGKMEHYQIKEIDSRLRGDALALVEQVFMEFEAPGFSEQGIETFRSFIHIGRIEKEIRSARLTLWGCFHEQRLVGTLGMESRGHICLLFVAKEYHRQGIARAMLEQGLMPFREKGFSHVTVNSSAYAVPVYQHLGFVVMQPEQCVSGIRFTPMTLHLA